MPANIAETSEEENPPERDDRFAARGIVILSAAKKLGRMPTLARFFAALRMTGPARPFQNKN